MIFINTKKMEPKIVRLIAMLTLLLAYDGSYAVEVRGNFELQQRYFFEEASFPLQHRGDLSFAAQPEFFWSWNEDADSLEIVPSIRLDQYDAKRTHGDLREFSWVHVSDEWESRIGVRRVFWGVTEFQHLVDIINQTDAVEDIDNEDKLGQPMLNLSLSKDWGIVDFYLMPYFRERTFAGKQGRPGLPFLNSDKALYESKSKQHHLDWAVRWTQSIDELELAISWFDGTSREPLLIQNPLVSTQLELIPFYQQIEQLGIELQQSVEDTLVKVEIIHNQNTLKSYWAMQSGIEYSQYGVFDSNADLGWLVEYSWDERGKTSPTIFQNDIFVGTRLALNDVDSSEVLMGLGYDLDFHSSSFIIESSTRFGDSIKVSLDARFFSSNKPTDPLYFFRNDDHVQLTAQYYY